MTEKKSFGNDVVLGDNVKILRIECAGDGGSCRPNYWIIFFFFLLFCIFAPIFIFITVNFVINIWVETETEHVVEFIEDCAAEGSLHPSLRSGRNSDQWLRGPGAHPEGTCKEIKKIVHQSFHYCKNCEGRRETPKEERPLILGQLAGAKDDPASIEDAATLEIRNLQKLSCGVENYEFVFEVPGGGKKLDPVKMSDLNLPEFCAGPDGIKWRILDSPRKSSARTYVMNADGTVFDSDRGAEGIQPQLTGGPYVTFIALEELNRRIANAYILYVDAVTRQPKLLEISFESLTGRKELVSREANVQLVSNLQLNSIDKEATFQFGSGAAEISVSGFDFGPKPTRDGSPAARRNVDASGSYEVFLNSAGQVEEVCRNDLPCGIDRNRRR